MNARGLVLDRFAWIGGHSDMWAVFRDAEALRAVVDALVEPYVGAGSPRCAGSSRAGSSSAAPPPCDA